MNSSPTARIGPDTNPPYWRAQFFQTIINTPEGANGLVSFTFDVPAGGLYYVVGRCMVPGPPEKAASQDSFELAVDGGERVRWDIPHVTPDRWFWCRAAGFRQTDSPFSFRLTRGKHQVTVYSRERLARLDRIVLSTAPYAEEPKAENP